MLQPKDTDWLNGHKHKTCMHAVHKRPTSDLGTHRDWKWEDGKLFHVNQNKKKARVAMLKADNWILKYCYKRQRRHCVIIKGSVQEEDITIVTIYASNRGASQ